MPEPKQSPPHPQPAPDPRDTQQNRRVAHVPPDAAQSPARAEMDPLPPARTEDEPVSPQGGHASEARTQGAPHRALPLDEGPEPSEAFFPPVNE